MTLRGKGPQPFPSKFVAISFFYNDLHRPLSWKRYGGLSVSGEFILNVSDEAEGDTLGFLEITSARGGRWA
jgi:hypothetical protein